MAYICSKDPTHQSTDSDYCSICGAKIDGAASALSPAQVSAPATISTAAMQGEICPDCGIPRHPGARFCEVCRYNYETRTSAGLSSIATAPIDATPTPTDTAPQTATSPTALAISQPSASPADLTSTGSVAPSPAAASSQDTNGPEWEAVVRVDVSLYTDPDPTIQCPVTDPERVFPLDLAENLIGRRSDRLDIHPEIPLTDPGVSHRHAKIYREADGSLYVLDVGSTNATTVNGTEAAAGVRVALNDGDEITIGCWTRIVIRKAVS